MATIRDIARMLGVSVSTVSLALSKPERVSAETLSKVLAAAREVGYVADPIARGLASGRTRLIGMVVADISNPFFGALLKAVEGAAAARGYLVIMSDSGGLATREREIIELLGAHRVAGIILQSSDLSAENAGHLAALKMPVVMIDQKLEGLAADFVGTDNRLASAMLAQHLLQLGHRRIGFIAGTAGLFTSNERTRGFVETLENAGVEVDPSLIADGHYEGEEAYNAAMQFLTRGDRPTAILAANNIMALGALQATYDLGFRCPDDISIASIDDVPWSNVIHPRLTCALQSPTRLGTLAAERLLARVADPSVREAAPVDLIVPPQFKLGASCRRLGEDAPGPSRQAGPRSRQGVPG
ncbi:MAG: LacI family DNA-binding transcriptional regulator [Devosia sp.]